jgi:Cu(I)/Ag(I) efflux system protein CusF
MKKLLTLVLIAAFAAFAWLSLPGLDQAQPPGTPQNAGGSGIVQHVDAEKGVVTITHGPLPALSMMAMTMSYAVTNKSQLAGLQPLQKVEFRVLFDGSDYLITEIK